MTLLSCKKPGSGAAVQFMVRDTQATRIGLVLTKDCQFLQLSWTIWTTNTDVLCFLCQEIINVFQATRRQVPVRRWDVSLLPGTLHAPVSCSIMQYVSLLAKHL
jgi:hypothetical protein